jgi:hypothetical protein
VTTYFRTRHLFRISDFWLRISRRVSGVTVSSSTAAGGAQWPPAAFFFATSVWPTSGKAHATTNGANITRELLQTHRRNESARESNT